MKCPRQDSNLYAVSDTGPSNQPVYQFQHVGDTSVVEPGSNDKVLGEGLEPSRGLPPQGPEPCASTNSATRARLVRVEPRGIEPLTS
jgi:hypothetical protein